MQAPAEASECSVLRASTVSFSRGSLLSADRSPYGGHDGRLAILHVQSRDSIRLLSIATDAKGVPPSVPSSSFSMAWTVCVCGWTPRCASSVTQIAVDDYIDCRPHYFGCRTAGARHALVKVLSLAGRHDDWIIESFRNRGLHAAGLLIRSRAVRNRMHARLEVVSLSLGRGLGLIVRGVRTQRLAQGRLSTSSAISPIEVSMRRNVKTLPPIAGLPQLSLTALNLIRGTLGLVKLFKKARGTDGRRS